MRKSFIAGNWKMHKTQEEAVSLARELVSSLKDNPNRIMIAPPFTALSVVNQVVKGTNILLGAQNMGPEEKGAHTGEVSVLMLKDAGVGIVILGHSERRHQYGEKDELINKKVNLALSNGLEVILCVGETLEEREAGFCEKVVEEQLRGGLAAVGKEQMQKVTIAYEPVWAIGTGKTATPLDANSVQGFIRRIIAEMYDQATADSIIIQYGGSVKPENVEGLMKEENIDGALVGGASLTVEKFIPIANYNKNR
jgi:triosephosphate isomerase